MQQERVTIRLPEEHVPRPVPWTRKLVWTLGNVLMVCGLYMVLYVGGLLANEQFNIYAASGTSEIELSAAPLSTPAPTPAPAQAAAGADVPSPTPAASVAPTGTTSEQSAWNVPTLNNGSSTELTSAVVPEAFSSESSTITRLVLPSLPEMGLPDVDKKVVEVGYSVADTVIQWNVDQYRVGHHQGTSNPGGGGNIVLSGHSGGTAYPFNDIYYLKPGDMVQLYSEDQLYNYAVTDVLLLDEVGQPWEKRMENAQYIQPTDREMITMVTCWPLTDITDENGRFIEKFEQRVIVRAQPTKPAVNVAQSSETNDGGVADSWVAR